MDIAARLGSSPGITVLAAVNVRAAGPEAGVFSFSVTPVKQSREVKGSDRVLLAMHYCSHVLARHAQEDAKLGSSEIELRRILSSITEEGVWPGSDLLRYAGVKDKVRLLGPEAKAWGWSVDAAVFRSLAADDLDLALEVPPSLAEPGLVLSVVAVFQSMLGILDDSGIELFDKALRYLRTYVFEAADIASPAQARNLANRAFRAAGGVAV